MDGIASVHLQQDNLSRQAMMYMLTMTMAMMYLLTICMPMGWFQLVHTSSAMTPEQSAFDGESVAEICACWALKEHVPLITKSSSVTKPTHKPVARQAQMPVAALLN